MRLLLVEDDAMIGEAVLDLLRAEILEVDGGINAPNLDMGLPDL